MLRYWWLLREITSRMWFSASIYGVVAVLAPFIAAVVEHFIPAGLPDQIGVESVDSILNVLAMSMLSVTIFSLSTMVAAYSAATSNVTPRATRLLITDKISHRALSTFLGSFIFAVVGIAALKGGVYGEMGRFVLYLLTLGVIAMVVLTLLRWIEYLARLGRVDETLKRVEEATMNALEARLSNPCLGGVCHEGDAPKSAKAIHSFDIGYVQHIDMQKLENMALEYAAKIYIVAQPGKFVCERTPLVYVTGTKIDDDLMDEVNLAFLIDENRSFAQDPRFGLAVMQEIAVRALSPAVNDPGTAIQVINAAVRVLSRLSDKDALDLEEAVNYPHVYVPSLKVGSMLEDIFPPIARDGAGNLQVHIWLQKAYASLAHVGDKELKKLCAEHAKQSLKRAEAAMVLKDDITVIKAMVKENFK